MKDIQVREATINEASQATLLYTRLQMRSSILTSICITNPMIFDPGRYDPGHEEDQKEAHSYLSWGADMYVITTLLMPLMFCILGHYI